MTGSSSDFNCSGRTSTKCDVCHDLRLDSPNAAEWFRFHPEKKRTATLALNHKDIKLSKLRGCNICGVILHAIGLYSHQRAPSSISLTIQAKDDALQRFFPLTIQAFIPITEGQTQEETDRLRELCVAGDFDGDGRPMKASSGDGDDDFPVDDIEGNEERGYNDDLEDEDGQDHDKVDQQVGKKTGYLDWVDLQLYEEQGHPAGISTGPARSVSQHPGSSRCMTLLRSWLSKCCERHDACSGPNAVPLPTRVISVGSGTTIPRLYIHDGAEKGSYAALSHCWGGDVPLQTRSQIDLERFQLGIPEEMLPPTFRDAVFVCRELQIPFLWIDSLCIIQDDKDDWSQESSHMGSYYAGAALTIAADHAYNSSEGCFKERSPCVWKSSRIDKRRFGLSADIHVRNMPVIIPDQLGHFFRKYDPASRPSRPRHPHPLSLRAWAMQEWFLSRRIVHFTADEMVWECYEEVFCECTIDQDPDHHRTAPKIPLQDFLHNVPAVYEEWTKIIKKFSMRQITYEEDRLPAVSGVADVFSKVTKDTYVCGVWKNCPLSLVWTAHVDPSRRFRQTDFYAPSWSWASIEGPIDVYDVDRNSSHGNFAEVLEIDWKPASKNVFGLAKRARLKIQGPVFSGKYLGFETRPIKINGVEVYEAGYWFSIQGHRSTWQVNLDFSELDLNRSHSNSLVNRPCSHLQAGDDFAVLVIGEGLNELQETEQRGLVLKVVDESLTTYRRIGTYCGKYWNATSPERIYAEEKIFNLV